MLSKLKQSMANKVGISYKQAPLEPVANNGGSGRGLERGVFFIALNSCLYLGESFFTNDEAASQMDTTYIHHTIGRGYTYKATHNKT